MSNILIIGGGGREHAIAWKLSQSPKVSKIYVAPGNGGTQQIAKNIPINSTDIDSLVKFAKSKDIRTTIVGPDDPLALGIVDVFRKNKLRIFGPTQSAAKIESSKSFSKELMVKSGIPTADFTVFGKYEEALEYVHSKKPPIVIKASGLALGKGVYVCNTTKEAEDALKQLMLERVHREAGDEVIVEEFLDGQEVSLHAFCDGETFSLFPSAQDHKPVYDGDRGSNTGGMGTIAPVPSLNSKCMNNLGGKFIQNTLDALSKEGRKFTDVLYPGLKLASGGPKALEFNARFGDPETQVYMRLLKTDLFDIIEACIDGRLSNIDIKWHASFAVCVILASEGYPGQYKKGATINGIANAEKIPGVVVFHAGTQTKDRLVTAGGRVMGVSAIGDTLNQAIQNAYKAIRYIYFDGMHYRCDIGSKVINKI